MTNPKLAYVYAGITILFWSTVASAFKLSLAYITFIPLVFYASVVSTISLGVLCAAKGVFSELSDWRAKDYLRSAFLGLLNPALYYLLLFKAYDLLPAQEAQVINFFWPVVLVLLGVLFLGQRISWVGVISISVSFLGVAIVATRGNILSLSFSSGLGVTLALSSTLVWATYWVINQTEQRDPLLRLFTNFLVGMGWMAIVMTLNAQWFLPNTTALLGSAYIGLFEMSLAFFCWFQALRLTHNVSFISNMIFITPFLSLLVISQIIKEPIYPSTLVGLGLICGAIIFQRKLSKPTNR